MRRNRGGLPKWALQGFLVLAALPFLAFSMRIPRWSEPSITHGPADSSMVALTFDDGLNGETTREAADVLERFGARGTFFVVAHTLTEQPDLATGLRAQGHLLANHSYDHPRATKTDLRYSQVWQAQDTFRRAFGECPRYFRPPWGVETPFIRRAVGRAHMRTVLWDVEVGDWEEADAQRLAANVLAKVRPGSIVLLHDGEDGIPGADRSTTVAALPAILEGLRQRGLTPVRLDTLLGTTGYIRKCG